MATDESKGRRIGWWPAAVAALVVIAIFFYARQKEPQKTGDQPGDTATAEPVPTTILTIATVAPTMPTVVNAPPPTATVAGLVSPESGDMPELAPSAGNATFYDPDGALPDGNTRGKPWQLDEKLAKTRESIKNVDLRAQALEKEIADAEAAGRKDEVAEKKIILARLRARSIELSRSLEAGVDPTTPPPTK